MSSRQDPGPDNIDAAFAEIVAGLTKEGVGAQWSEDQWPTDQLDIGEPDSSAANKSKTGQTEPDDELDHYIAPEPPPLGITRLRPSTLFGIVVVFVGALGIIAPHLFGLAATIGKPLGLITLCLGAGWLALRRNSRDSGDSDELGPADRKEDRRFDADGDDGAVV